MTRRDWLAEDPRRITYEPCYSALTVLLVLAPIRPVERLYAFQERQETDPCDMIDVECTVLDG